jgi:hypothetical protein
MATRLRDITFAALSLPPDQRAQLAQQLPWRSWRRSSAERNGPSAERVSCQRMCYVISEMHG